MTKQPSHYGIGSKRKPSSDFMDRLPVEVLTYLAADPARLGRFFDTTGLDVPALRQSAGTPSFDSSLLDYLGSDESLLRDFAQQHGYDPAEVDTARMILAGPQESE
ncbi:MAG: DUF3572 domain-containing protein [Beijerinckiaceae bacterium]